MNVSRTAYIRPSVLEASKPSEKEFLSLLTKAEKSDHQIYTESKLQPIHFGINARLPSVFNIIQLPFEIGYNLSRMVQKSSKTSSKTIEEPHLQLISQCINLCTSCLTPIAYLGTVGLFIARKYSVIAAMSATSLLYSIFEIALNSYRIYQTRTFSKCFNLTLLKDFTQLTSAVSAQQLQTLIHSLIPKFQALPLYTSAKKQHKLLKTLQNIENKLISETLDLRTAKERLKPIIAAFQREFVTSKMELLGEKFFLLNTHEKQKINAQCQRYYHKQSYGDALYHSFSMIQEKFKDKKIALAQRVEPWLAIRAIKEYSGIMHNLYSAQRNAKQEGVKQAIDLLERLDYNARLKTQIAFTNIVLFSIVILSASLTLASIAHPIASICTILLLYLIYYLNDFRIQAVLNSRTYHVDWIKCCPTWVVTIGNKLHRLFYKTKALAPKIAFASPIPPWVISKMKQVADNFQQHTFLPQYKA